MISGYRESRNNGFFPLNPHGKEISWLDQRDAGNPTSGNSGKISAKYFSRDYGIVTNAVFHWEKQEFVDDDPMVPANTVPGFLLWCRRPFAHPFEISAFDRRIIVCIQCGTRFPIFRIPSLGATFNATAQDSFRLMNSSVKEREDQGIVDWTFPNRRVTGVHGKKTGRVAVGCLQNLIPTVPGRMYTILTDKGVRFANRLKDRHILPQYP